MRCTLWKLLLWAKSFKVTICARLLPLFTFPTGTIISPSGMSCSEMDLWKRTLTVMRGEFVFAGFYFAQWRLKARTCSAA